MITSAIRIEKWSWKQIKSRYFQKCCWRGASTFMLFTIISVHRTIFWNILRLMKGHRISGWTEKKLFKLGSSMWGLVGLYGWIYPMNGLIHNVDGLLQTTWHTTEMLSHGWKIKMNCFWVNIINIFLPCSKWFPNWELTNVIMKPNSADICMTCFSFSYILNILPSL